MGFEVKEGKPNLRSIRILTKGVCAYCDQHAKDEMTPPHDPSPRCESGKRPHCTCDVCF
jgi:hypothetical protein